VSCGQTPRVRDRAVELTVACGVRRNGAMFSLSSLGHEAVWPQCAFPAYSYPCARHSRKTQVSGVSLYCLSHVSASGSASCDMGLHTCRTSAHLFRTVHVLKIGFAGPGIPCVLLTPRTAWRGHRTWRCSSAQTRSGTRASALPGPMRPPAFEARSARHHRSRGSGPMRQHA